MTRTWARELTGWVTAFAVAAVTAGAVATSPRSELLFRDGDSLVVALLAQSLRDGGPLDWALSSVLFLPETALYTGLDALLPFEVDGMLAASAVVNLLALYGAFRFAAGRAAPGRAPVAWSVVALGVFGLLATTEVSAFRDAWELASLQLTTTYYSATVVAVVVSVGAVRRLLDAPSHPRALLVMLGLTAGVSTLSNPLYAAWATAPLAVLLGVGAARATRPSRVVTPLCVIVGATALGFAARIPFSAWIANTGAAYVQPSQWRDSFGYYGGLAVDRLTAPLGVLSAAIVLILLVVAAVVAVRAPDSGARVVALFAAVAPVAVVLGAILLGTHAARYLQPVVFAPVLVLVADPRILAVSSRAHRRLLAVAACAMLVVGGASSIPRLVAAAEQPDADLACVTDWISASGRTGAGQFWTVRLPKLHLDDASQLVQVDHALHGYAWLVDRADFAVGAVSFLVEDAQTVPWELPESVAPTDVIECGRYTILDFGDRELALGPAHS